MVEVAICHTFFGAKQWVEPLPLTTQIFLLKNLKNERISRNDCQMRSVQNLFIPLLVDYRGLHYPIHWGLSQYHNSLKRMRFRVTAFSCLFQCWDAMPRNVWQRLLNLQRPVYAPQNEMTRTAAWESGVLQPWHSTVNWHGIDCPLLPLKLNIQSKGWGVQDIVIFVILNCNYIAYIYISYRHMFVHILF